jgi:hypothetical protein
MTMNKRGFTPIALILLVVAGIAVLGGVFYYYLTPASIPPVVVTTSTTPTSTSNSTSTATSSPIGTYKAYLSPTSGLIGSTVTIHGSGFAATGNKVLFNGMVAASMSNLSSANGKTLTFVVPQDLGPNCKPNEMCAQYLMVVGARAYTVTVVSNGVTQNLGTFTVTAGGDTKLPM